MRSPVMKVLKFLMMSLIACAGSHAVSAEVLFSKVPYRLAPDETIQNLLLVHAPEIILDGLAADDVFLLALPANSAAGAMTNDNLRLNGTFSNDVWAVGVNVRVTGTINDHARIAALRLLDINGAVHNGLLAAGETVRIGTEARIGRQAFVVGTDVILEGLVQGPASIRAHRVTVAGTIEGDTIIRAQDVVLLPGARIEGNLVYTMARELVPPPGAHVAGALRRHTEPTSPATPRMDWAMTTQSFLLAGALATGMLLFWLSPTLASQSVQVIRLGPWRAALVGFAAFCLIPVTALLLFITLVGIPLALVGGLLFVVLMYFGRILTAAAMGALIFRAGGTSCASRFFAGLTVGLLCLFLLANLPSPFGLVIWFASTWVGMGGILLAALDRRCSGVINARQAPRSPPPLPPDQRPAA